ncbi:hypothetical protein Tco_0588152 [Tanacetum coccineum]
MLTECGDDVASIKRRRRDLSSDGVRELTTTSGRNRLKSDLEVPKRKSTSDHILKEDIGLHFIPTQYQLAEIFTKPLDELTFKRLIVELELIPKEEPDTQPQIRPESPNPFLPTLQDEFNFDEITFNTNNEVSLLYPSHLQSEYFQGIKGEVSVTTSRNALRANYLSHSRGKTGGHDQISNKDAIILYYLVNGVEIDFSKVIWEYITHKLNKKSKKIVVPYPWFISLLLEYMMPKYENDKLTLNPTQVFSVYNCALKPNQPEGPPFTDHMLATCKADVLVKSKALRTSSKAEKKVSQGKMPGAKTGLKRKQSLKHTSKSKNKANKCGSSSPTGFKTCHLAQETHSSSAVDTNPSQPSVSTPVATDLHKKDQQATGGPTSLGTTRCDASVDSTAKADPKTYAPNDSIPQKQDNTKSVRDGLKTANTNLGTNVESSSAEISKTIKLEDLSKLMQDVKTNFMDLDSLEDELIFVQDEYEEEEEVEKYEDTHATSHEETKDSSVSHPPSLKTIQLRELTNQWELPAEFLALPSKVSSVQAKLKTLDALPSLLNEGELIKKYKGKATMSSKDDEEKETESNSENDSENDYTNPADSMVESSKKKKLKKFDFVTEGGEHIHFTAEKIEEQKGIEESLKAKFAKQEVEKVKNKLVDLMGIDVVTKYYKNKLPYDKYCDKILKRRKSSKITNCDVFTRRGPITLKVHRKDGTTEVIPKFKTSDLHLAEWREAVQAYPLDELNDLANKKRKRADDFHDYFRSTKKFEPSVRYEDHPAGTVLNEPVLGIILFNSFQRQGFVTTEDFEDLSNEMLYNVQEVFYRFHQGPDLNDHVRTFSSFLFAEVDTTASSHTFSRKKYE